LSTRLAQEDEEVVTERPEGGLPELSSLFALREVLVQSGS
jgi:hypothetical protein